MKYLSLILFSAFALASCKKDNNGGCITRINSVVPVSAADMASIQALLTSNHITANNQVFTVFRSYPGPDTLTSYQYAQATQIRNGLPIFYGDLVYSFVNSVYQGLSGRVYGAVSLDDKSSMQLPGLRQLFLNEAILKQGLNKSFNDSCYVAQFGYFNVNQLSSDTSAKFVKAWQVRPKNSLYPQCYTGDATGSTLYFDSGIRPLDVKKDDQ